MNSFYIIAVIALMDLSIGTVYFFTSSILKDVSDDQAREQDVKDNFMRSLYSDIDDNAAIDYKEPSRTPSKDRLAVITYIPNSVGQVYQFLVMLYGSWKYIIDHQLNSNKDEDEFHNLNDVDLIVFCHSIICKKIEHVCAKIDKLSDISTTTQQKCWAVEQPFEVNIPYAALNSFIMFNRTDIIELVPRYKFLLRTESDTFVTPALHELKPKRFLYGQGGPSSPFIVKHLQEVAQRLSMVHRGNHNIGSTWCGDATLFIKAGIKTLEITRYLWLNEFGPAPAEGLETKQFTANNRDGEWKQQWWWRPASLFYGGEITLNHLIDDISEDDENKVLLDAPVCQNISIWKVPHIHLAHNNCKFQKFRFMKYLNIAIKSKDSLPGGIIHRIIKNAYNKDINNMNLQEYSTFIAWNSVSKYLNKWFL